MAPIANTNIIWYLVYMKELKKNEIYTVSIDGYTSEGSGVCHVEERAVFVPGTICGEQWRVRIVKVGKTKIYGKGEVMMSASPARVMPACPFFGKCGGCDLWHMDYREELRFKLQRVNDALRHIGRQDFVIEQILGSEQQEGYRNKGIFAVGLSGGKPACGFYRERSHDLIPVERCLIQSELSCRTAAAVTAFLAKHQLAPYDEQSGCGTVRHVFCRHSVSGTGSVVCVVSARGFGALTQPLVDCLRETCPELTGIVLNINKAKGNTVLAGKFYTLWGDPCIQDSLCGFQFSISPQAFFQINPPQAEKLYRKAVDYASSFSPGLLLDLYCGAGTISLCMSGIAEHVIGAEIVPEAVENARQNAQRNQITNVEFQCADAGEAAMMLAQRGVKPDVIVVDPPRKGLDSLTVEAIRTMSPAGLVYVSCNPATLARDILMLNDCGYELQAGTAVDMFPRTSHVETVCCLYHQKKDFIYVSYEPKNAE